MVLESIFPLERIMKNKFFAFFIGIFYSVICIIVAFYLFRSNFIIFAVSLTSLLLLPLVNKLLKIQKDMEIRNEHFSIKEFFSGHSDFFQIYLSIFMGIILSFSIMILITPDIIFSHLFENQAEFALSLYTDSGKLQFGDFFMIAGNNVKVVLVCYLAAFFFGTGAVFVITWNASVWGTIFGAIAKNAAVQKLQSPFLYSLLLGIVVMPYLIIEASAYLIAGISGGIVSKAAIDGDIHSKKFENVIKKSLIMLWLSLSLIVVGALVESQLAPHMFDFIFG